MKHNFLLFFIPITIYQTTAQQCHQPGICLNGVIVGINDALGSYNECLAYCQSNQQCNWFSFMENEKNCFTYVDCPTLDTSVENVFSGERACSPQSTCNEPGFCDGTLVGYHSDVTIVDDCINFCKIETNCYWYTYYPSSKQCLLFADCTLVEDGCSDCIHGQKECNIDQGYSNLLMVVGSYYEHSKAEIVDLSGQQRECSTVSNFPNAYGSVGTFIDNNALVCGGRPNKRECYQYSPTNDLWSLNTTMIYERYVSAGLKIDSGRWWITGDLTSGGNGITTEMHNENVFANYTDLPAERADHYLVRVNLSHVMLVGSVDETRETYFFDLVNEQWSNGPDTLIAREQAIGGFIRFKNGTEVVALVGAFDTHSSAAEYFNIQDQTWSIGADLPYGVTNACVAQLDDTFLIIGNNFSPYRRNILKFDIETESWIVLEEQLSFETIWSACFFVPDDFVSCT